MNKKYEYSISWSVNGRYIYLDNDTFDEREVVIDFYDFAKYPKEVKIAILKDIIKELSNLKEK